MKEKFIRAYMYCFGTTRKEAVKTYRECVRDGKTGYISAIIESYCKDTHQAFYND